MESSDVLIVTKLNRLCCNAIDVCQTVELLTTNCICVHCLSLGCVDLTAAGKMTMHVLGGQWPSLNVIY